MTDLTILDTTIMKNADEPLRTAARLAAMVGEPAPMFVPWGKVFKTSEGNFRIRCELNKSRRRGAELMIAHLDRVS
jgi:hypothetical protein